MNAFCYRSLPMWSTASSTIYRPPCASLQKGILASLLVFITSKQRINLSFLLWPYLLWVLLSYPDQRPHRLSGRISACRALEEKFTTHFDAFCKLLFYSLTCFLCHSHLICWIFYSSHSKATSDFQKDTYLLLITLSLQLFLSDPSQVPSKTACPVPPAPWPWAISSPQGRICPSWLLLRGCFLAGPLLCFPFLCWVQQRWIAWLLLLLQRCQISSTLWSAAEAQGWRFEAGCVLRAAAAPGGEATSLGRGTPLIQKHPGAANTSYNLADDFIAIWKGLDFLSGI